MVGHIGDYEVSHSPDRWPSTMHNLRALGLRHGSVEAVHLPSKLQETMILATAMDRDRRLYIERYEFTIPRCVDLGQLNRVLYELADKHSTLRSLYCWNRDHHGAEVALVVLEPDYVRKNVQLLWKPGSPNAHRKQGTLDFRIYGPSTKPSNMWKGSVPWRISILPLPGTPRCKLSLTYHHALMDGTSARQLLLSIHQELESPGSVTDTSDMLRPERELARWRTSHVEMRLRERFQQIITPPTIPLQQCIPSHEKGSKILTRSLQTSFRPQGDMGAIPAWIARLALALALCEFQGTHDALFYETLSARRFVSEESCRALGLMLATQPRHVYIPRSGTLDTVAQSLRSTHDITHMFTAGELRSMIPELGNRLPVGLICQTHMSCPTKGIRDWEWVGRETLIDMALLVELMPVENGLFDLNLHYHGVGFSDKTMTHFHSFLCDMIQHLQKVHTRLEHYNADQAVQRIRTGNMELDTFLHRQQRNDPSPARQNIPDRSNDIKHSGGGAYELREIEAMISQHPRVNTCTVLRGESWQGQALLALIELEHGTNADWGEITTGLMADLSQSLPPCMLPSHFIRVHEDLPTTRSRNVDWRKLACLTNYTKTNGTTTSNGTRQNGHKLNGGMSPKEEDDLRFWASQLENSQAAEFFHDRHRPTEPSSMSSVSASVPAAVYANLREACRRRRVPLLTMLFSCLRAAHYRMTGVTDANIGIVLPDVARDVCLRTQVDDDDCFENLVQQVKSTLKAVSCHSASPTETILSKLNWPSEKPLVRVALALHSQPFDIPSLENIDQKYTSYDMEFHFWEKDNELCGLVHFSTGVYASPTIRAILSVVFELMERGIQSPERSIATIPLTNAHGILDAMGLTDEVTGNYPHALSIVDLFEQQAAVYPDYIVVKDGSRQLTYTQLNHDSDRVASWLRARGFAAETIIGILSPRSYEAIVAIVGILKAGLAYVPMEHNWPNSRLETILNSLDSPRLLLLGPGVGRRDVTVDSLTMLPIFQVIRENSQTPSVSTTQGRPLPSSLAYIIFTSGSTGQPKGVMTEHQAVISRVRPSTNVCTGGTTRKAMAHMASLAFDAAAWEIYAALLNCGTIVCIDSVTVLDYPALDRVFEREAVRVAFITPGLLKELVAASPKTVSRLDSIAVGGDRSDPTTLFHALKLVGSGEIVHVYGPTEHTIYSTKYVIPANELGVNGVPIGRVLPGSGAYVMDSKQSLVPLGVLGELVVTGDGLARGYTDPARNKDRFITITVQGRQVRAYRTGDRVRYRPGDGLIEYLDRIDNQVKIRGQRVELGEIQHALQKQDGIDSAAVILQKDQEGNNQLVAFVTESPVNNNCLDTAGPLKGFTSTFISMNPTSRADLGHRLREKLKSLLPSYMVPAVITMLDRMPLNANGKVDRQALARIEVVTERHDMTPMQAPRNKIEKVICDEFSRVLACAVGVTDNFYDLGGHSLIATRAIFQIGQQLECSLSIRDLLEAPTPEALAEHIAAMEEVCLTADLESPDLPLLPPLEVEGWQDAVCAVGLDLRDVMHVMPCSPFQEGVLSADIGLNERSGYRVTTYIELPCDLDHDALSRAWRVVVEREDLFRTAFLPVVVPFARQGIVGNSFLQAVLRLDSPQVRRVLEIEDFGTCENGSAPDVGLGHVPVSLSMTQSLSRGNRELILTTHHAIYDGPYLTTIVRRLSEAYTLILQRADNPYPYQGDIPFSAFIRMLQARDYSQVSSFWKSYMQRAPIAMWPVPMLAPGANRPTQLPQVKTVSWFGDVRGLARRFHTTPACLGRAAVAMTISAHSGTEDVVMGEVSSGRYYSSFVAGPCIATHPVRIRLTGSQNERSCLEAIINNATESYAQTIPHQHFGLNAIRRESEFPDQAPFNVLFVYQHDTELPAGQGSNSSADFRSRRGQSGQVDFPLVIEAFCAPSIGEMQFHCTFDPDSLPPHDADWALEHLVMAMDLMNRSMESSSRPFHPTQLIGLKERDVLQRMSMNPDPPGVSDYDSELCVHEVISTQARKTPAKIALQFEQSEFITYQQLDDWSTRLSRAIRSVLMKNRDGSITAKQHLVPICFDKSPQMVVVILAVLKAGAAYVPLDPEHPVPRLTAICQAADASMVIWDNDIAGDKLHSVCQNAKCSLWTVESLRNLSYNEIQNKSPVVLPSDLAYVLFTSGSTGTPKGVMVEHRNLTAFMQARAGSTDCSWTSNRLSMLAYTFDASVGDLFGTLGKGGRLCLVRRKHLMSRLTHWLDSLAVSHLALTPTLGSFLFNNLRAQGSGLQHLNTLVFGGESFRHELLEQIPQQMTVWNGYGPTETTIEVTAWKVQGLEGSPHLNAPYFPIGKPIGQSRIYLLYPGTDEQTPMGAVGELCIGGPQVSRGYLGHADLTAKHFVRDPFCPGGSMYRSGDFARWHGDGTLEYLGRMDGQLKLRGLRIEPGEIAAAAEAHSLVKTAIVTKVQCNDTEALIVVAHVHTPALDLRVTAAEIHECISQRVPEYMVPAQVQLRNEPFPQTSSGKMDIRAVTRTANEKYQEWLQAVTAEANGITRAAAGTVESQISKHWANVLGLSEDKIDITASFSQLGGDSIRAISLLAALRREGLPLHMPDLRQSATIQTQATKVRERNHNGGSPSAKEMPGYMHIYKREGSIATVVLVHPFLAQSKIFEPLVPYIDEQFNVILIDDPFFGTRHYPESLTAWASVYLQDIMPLLPKNHRVIMGGYSFGGLIAMEMATVWREQRASYPVFLVLLDPGTYAPTELQNSSEEERQEAAQAALSLLGVEQRAMASFQEHYDRHNRVLRQTRPPAVYPGRVLYLALPERLKDSVGHWWKSQCPRMTTQVVDCDDHYSLLKQPVLEDVAQAINRHCCQRISEISTRRRRSTISASLEVCRKSQIADWSEVDTMTLEGTTILA